MPCWIPPSQLPSPASCRLPPREPTDSAAHDLRDPAPSERAAYVLLVPAPSERAAFILLDLAPSERAADVLLVPAPSERVANVLHVPCRGLRPPCTSAVRGCSLHPPRGLRPPCPSAVGESSLRGCSGQLHGRPPRPPSTTKYTYQWRGEHAPSSVACSRLCPHRNSGQYPGARTRRSPHSGFIPQ